MIFRADTGIESLADLFVLAGNIVEQLQALIEKAFLLRAKPRTIVDQTGMKKETAALGMPLRKPLGGPLQRASGLHAPVDVAADVLKPLQPARPRQSAQRQCRNQQKKRGHANQEAAKMCLSFGDGLERILKIECGDGSSHDGKEGDHSRAPHG